MNNQIIPNTDDFMLGDSLKDNVSGWEGAATAYYVYMNGCVRVVLDGVDKDGKPTSYVFDVEQLSATDKPSVKRATATPSGGPRDNTPAPR